MISKRQSVHFHPEVGLESQIVDDGDDEEEESGILKEIAAIQRDYISKGGQDPGMMLLCHHITSHFACLQRFYHAFRQWKPKHVLHSLRTKYPGPR